MAITTAGFQRFCRFAAVDTVDTVGTVDGGCGIARSSSLYQLVTGYQAAACRLGLHGVCHLE
ncbi:MAG TPA: hypothetical protein PLH67_11445 [Lentisphaeria bacterium]|nr:hypothetical protein [Lentisphaeria bacterium]